MKQVLMIGCGAIGRHVLGALDAHASARISHVIMRPARVTAVQAELGPGIEVVGGVAAIEGEIDFAVECAGHGGLVDHGAAVLRRGIDLAVVSIGALADDALLGALGEAAKAGGARLRILAGAVGGLDALSAAREGGLAEVVYTSRKPPGAWKGSPAEAILDLDDLSAATVFFEGPAREAAQAYPKNANVAATVALAGLGLDATLVRLAADPAAPGNVHRIEASGAFGRLEFEIQGATLPDNPRTSALTAFCILRAIRNRTGLVEI